MCVSVCLSVRVCVCVCSDWQQEVVISATVVGAMISSLASGVWVCVVYRL